MECVEALVDDFSVDDLLDLSNADDIVRQEIPTEEDEQVPHKQSTFSDQSAHLSSSEDLLSVPGAELDFPVDDLAELEWLSNFVEDSFSEPCLSGGLPMKPNSFSGNDAPHAAVSVASAEKPFFRTPVPAKARSKRRRTGGHVWSLEPPSGNDTSASSSPSYSSLCPASKQAAAKNKGRKRISLSGGRGGGAQQQRRCSHCGVQKTPQWRMGPLGAKTLCNACGVRFKSGRLLPEYRPACSPTFSGDIHSNSHRKVMELRRMKEVSALRVEPGLTRPCA